MGHGGRLFSSSIGRHVGWRHRNHQPCGRSAQEKGSPSARPKGGSRALSVALGLISNRALWHLHHMSTAYAGESPWLR